MLSYRAQSSILPPRKQKSVRQMTTTPSETKQLRPRLADSLLEIGVIERMVDALTLLEKKCAAIIFVGAMSHGSISKEAHMAIAEAINRVAMRIHGVTSMAALKRLLYPAGPLSNSGEGGELAERDGTLQQSRIRQVASGRFGVTVRYLNNAVEIQIKVNQGAKPGVGGELPGKKVNAEIAAARHAEEGVTLASPPPHHDIYSIEDLRQLIHDLKSANPSAAISVKLAASQDIGIIAAGVAKCGANVISIAGPGGTGAAPQTAKHEFVHPWETALAEVHQTLTANGLRDSVKLVVSGGLQTGLDYFKALLLGANYVEGGTSMLTALGCIMAEVCHNGTCPAGIATTNQKLIDEKFKGKPEDVVRLLLHGARSLAHYLQKYGFSDPAEAVGRTDLLRVKDNSPLTDLEKLLVRVTNPYSGSFIQLPPVQGSSYAESEVTLGILAGKRHFELKAETSNLSFGARISSLVARDPKFKAALRGPDLTIQVPESKENYQLACQDWQHIHPSGSVLLIYSAHDLTWKALYKHNKQGDVAETTIDAKSEIGQQLSAYPADQAKLKALLQQHVLFKDLPAMNFITEPVRVTFTGPVGQSFGYVACEGLELEADISADGTGKSLDGGLIVIKQAAGNQAAYGATRGDVFAPFMGDRAGVRLSGANLVAEQVGEMAANFMTRGAMTIIGTPKHYPNIALNISYTPPVQARTNTIGANLASGMHGGQIMMPVRLYDEVRAKGLLSPHARQFVPQSLATPEQKTLEHNLMRYAERTGRLWVRSLNSQQSQFIKLDPKALVSTPQRALHTSSEAKDSLYDPMVEKDACGVGALVNLGGKPSHHLVDRVLTMLPRLQHRGANGIDPKTGDGCGVVWFGLEGFFQHLFPKLSLKKGHFSVIPIQLSNEIAEQQSSLAAFKRILALEGLSIADERDVSTRRDLLGHIGQQQEQVLRQFVILKPESMSETDFEKALIRTQLRMLFHAQNNRYKIPPHVLSASKNFVVYTSLVKESDFPRYFMDFQHPHFQASAGGVHSRFSTNSLPKTKNIQPTNTFQNNGECNNINLIMRQLTHDPHFAALIAPSDPVLLDGLSDSMCMSIWIAMLQLQDMSAEEIVASTIQPFNPQSNLVSLFYNLYGGPFEGPNASIIYAAGKLIFVRDLNGFRPLVGVHGSIDAEGDYFYAGSEIGPVDIQGSIYNFPPGKPFMIDLETGKMELLEPSEEKISAIELQFIKLRARVADEKQREPLLFSAEERDLRCLRAGLNQEVVKTIIEPLATTGKVPLRSMGDQGPIERLVQGAYFDLYSFLKGQFAQVTNPPLAIKEEGEYMSTRLVVGKKPAIHCVLQESVSGYLLDSPIIDNVELAAYQADPTLRAEVVDITYPVSTQAAGLNAAIQRVVQQCIEKVKQGSQLIILSDLNSNDTCAAIPAILAASAVEQGLLKAGLRTHAAIAIQAASILSGHHVAAMVSIAGVDLVNPYLALCYINNPERCARYKEGLRQELLSYMARMGISTLTAYRGSKLFNGYGLSSDLTALLGIKSTLGGLTLKTLAGMIQVQHAMPLQEGFGRLDYQGQHNRKKIWGREITLSAIKAARLSDSKDASSSYEAYEREANLLKIGFPRGQLRLIAPTVWSTANPMPVAIRGGGAAGFYQAKALLDSGLPVSIHIFEEKRANSFGLLHGGIAPDHAAMKQLQGGLLLAVLDDSRVKYWGGVDVSFAELQQHFPCIIGCRGSAENIRLNIPGENLQGVMDADAVYKWYNGEFTPFRDNPNPFRVPNTSPNLLILGGGNVALDLARIFLKDPHELATTKINPEFLQYLHSCDQQDIRIVMRGHPSTAKFGMHELRELEKLGMCLSASFDPSLDPFKRLAESELAKLSAQDRKAYEKQCELYDFFTAIHNRKVPVNNEKRLHFIFQLTPKVIAHEQGNPELTVVMTDQHGAEQVFSAGHVIKALGKAKPKQEEEFVSGWNAGIGGNLGAARASAEQTSQHIKQQFASGAFHHRTPPLRDQPWMLVAETNEAVKRIWSWRQQGNPLRSVKDYKSALHYHREETPSKMDNNAQVVTTSTSTSTSTPTSVSTPTGRTTISIPASGYRAGESVLTWLQRQPNGAVPEHQCDGTGSCGQCVVRVEPPIEPAKRNEADLVRIIPGSNVKTDRLGCQVTVEQVAGKSVSFSHKGP